MSDRPNLIERMENLLAALDEAIEDLQTHNDRQGALTSIDTAMGIGGEVLTMIDGR